MEFSKVLPELLVQDISTSLTFYRDVLGFSVAYQRPEEKFVFLEREGAQLMLLEDGGNEHSRTGIFEYPRGRGLNLSIRTTGLDGIEFALDSAGHPLRIPVREQWHRQDDLLHGERQLWVMDPDGYLLRFVERLGTRPAR